jgi:MFS family permease
MVPSGLAAPFLAFLADRGRCERVLALSLAARAALLFLCGLAAWVELPAPSIYALAVVASVLARLANPAQAALLPLLARQPRQLRIANTVVSQTESLASVLGPALAGALLALVEPATVFVLAASGVLGASFLAWRIQAEEIPPLVAEAGRQRKFFAGLATVATNRSLRLLVSLYALQTLVAGALNVFLVVLALHAFDLGEGGVGSLNAALGLGGLLGGLVLYRRARERLSDDLRLGLFLWSLPLAALALVPVAAVAFVALALVGIGNTLVDVSTFTLVQRITPGPVRARVFGLLEGLSVAAIGVGALLAPVLMAVCGIRWSLATLGLFLALSTAAWWRGLSDEMTDAADRLATRADIRCSPFAPSMAS